MVRCMSLHCMRMVQLFSVRCAVLLSGDVSLWYFTFPSLFIAIRCVSACVFRLSTISLFPIFLFIIAPIPVMLAILVSPLCFCTHWGASVHIARTNALYTRLMLKQINNKCLDLGGKSVYDASVCVCVHVSFGLVLNHFEFICRIRILLFPRRFFICCCLNVDCVCVLRFLLSIFCIAVLVLVCALSSTIDNGWCFCFRYFVCLWAQPTLLLSYLLATGFDWQWLVVIA